MINSAMSGLEPVEPSIIQGEHDMVLHTFGSSVFMRLDLAGRTFYRVTVRIDNSYQTEWPWGITA
jgi:hypothetical protein